MANIIPSNASVAQDPEEGSQGRMSFFEHLAELRKRLINSFIAIALGAIGGMSVSKRFIHIITLPMINALRANGLDPHLYIRSPAGYVSLWINVGLAIGVGVAMPFVLYQVWLFVAPGLYKHERSAVTGFIVFGTLLFACGVAFSYFIMLPQMLNFLVHFTNDGSI